VIRSISVDLNVAENVKNAFLFKS